MLRCANLHCPSPCLGCCSFSFSCKGGQDVSKARDKAIDKTSPSWCWGPMLRWLPFLRSLSLMGPCWLLHQGIKGIQAPLSEFRGSGRRQATPDMQCVSGDLMLGRGWHGLSNSVREGV